MHSCTDTRPTRDMVNMAIAMVVAERGTCLRRRVGCVITDSDGFILATGYNGVAAGRPHCREEVRGTHPFACQAASAPSGTQLDGCEALHAEQNAVIRLADPRRAYTTYVTTSPCVSCVKLLLGTGCQRICFLSEYAHSDARKWWEGAGRSWIKLEAPTF